jgi:hypothetical protein
MVILVPPDWTNPFAQFLNDAHSALRKIPRQPEVRTDASLLPSFVQICEDRRFVFDIVERIEALATAFDRLRALDQSYIHSRQKTDGVIAEQRAGDPDRVNFKVPDEPLRERDQYAREARVLVAFAYYEMSTVVTLLGGLFKPLPTHLEYLVGVRNKMLSHPRRDAFVKNSSSALTLGPILHANLVGAESWVPLLRDWYLQKLKDAGGWLDDDKGVASNVALLRSGVRVAKFTLIDRLRLKSYVIREPDLLQSASEMAALLEAKFLQEIRDACRPAR